jgi:ribosomal protein L11 methyltransferase
MPDESMNKDGPGGGGEKATRGWLVVDASVAGEPASSVAAVLLDVGGTAVEERSDGGLVTWIRLGGAPRATAEAVREALEARFGPSLRLSWHIAPDEDWLRGWRRGLGPRRVGDRIVVSPSWAASGSRAGDLVIWLDPEMAFGTGEHGSTRTAIRLLEQAGGGRRALDVGAGSGILSIVAAKLGARVLALEADADAVRTTERNVVRNGVQSRVRVVHLSVEPTVLRLLRGSLFDRILVNVERGFIQPLLPEFAPLLSSGGELIVAGILAEEADELMRGCHAAGLGMARQTLDEGWWAGAFTLAAAPV